jgi:flavin reductase (DIM6/NTAB) family NADH-FMN oxidoreductase RutF
MLHLCEQDILQMENFYRAAFVNSLSGFKSASLIGTIDKNKQTNLAVFSSVFHLGSNPALMGFINRPDSVDRHTLKNILDTKNYTINHINKLMYKQAHQTSARYPKEVSEFEATGLTEAFGNRISSPYVKESQVKYGMEFAEKHELKINGTILVIGKIVEVFLPNQCLLPHGAIDIERAETVAISGLDAYHKTQPLARLTYAKMGKTPEEMG